MGQRDLLSRLAELAGMGAAVVAFAALFSSDDHLRRSVPVFLGVSLALLGAAEVVGARLRRRRGDSRPASQEGYGRFCLLLGLVQVGFAIVWPSTAPFTGAPVCGVLIWLGLRGPGLRPGRGRSRGGARVALGKLTLITVGCVLLIYVSLAAAVIVSHDKHQPGPEDHHGSGEPGRPPSAAQGPEPPPRYADLCPSLPNPLEIGHGLGELFRRDGAIKAGCGTEAFQVPGTGTWVAAGMCFGERRSVAVSAPGRTAIVYGEAAEFVWEAAQDGELTAVEAAAPEGGDVVLVETRSGTYGFARATRSATPGNENARKCNEVGGSAEPFARMPPPLVWLWVELVHGQATWFWPAADPAGGGDSVAFISPQGVANGDCTSDAACELTFEGRARSLDSPAFETLESLREYMPAE